MYSDVYNEKCHNRTILSAILNYITATRSRLYSAKSYHCKWNSKSSMEIPIQVLKQLVLIESVVNSYKVLLVVIYSSQLLNLQKLVFRMWNFNTGALLNIYIITISVLEFIVVCYFTSDPGGFCSCIWSGNTFPFYPLGFWVFVSGRRPCLA